MMRGLKILASVVGVIFLLAVIAAISLVLFVSPNRFKPLITEQVMKTTGRQLSIDGDLSWTLFPALGVKVGHIEFYNPPGFSQKVFAEVDHAIVSVKVMPLFHAQIESSGIVLKGMKINLIKNANGQTNWQDFQGKSSPSVDHVDRGNSSVKKTSVDLTVSALDIENANVFWIDEQSKKNIAIEQFDLHAKNISLTKKFPLKTSFKFVSKNPPLNGKFSLTCDVTLNPETQYYLFTDAEIITNMNRYVVNVKGDVAADLSKQTIRLDHFKTQIANFSATGNMTVVNLLSNPQAAGHLQINPFDLKEFMQNVGKNTADLQILKDVSGVLDFNFNAPDTVTAQGKFKVDTVQTAKVKITDIHADMRFQNHVLQLMPVTAKFYEGALSSEAKIDLNNSVPKIALQAKLVNVQVGPLLTNVAGADQKFKLSGTGNIDLQITTAGLDANTVVRNLNGNSRLSFNNGVLEGIDLGYMIDSTVALTKGQDFSKEDSHQTTFGNLTATAVIQNGVVSNNDLHFDAPRFDSTGSGTVDLVNQQINYGLQIKVKKISDDRKDNWLDLYGMAIPVTIKGSLQDPKVRLDTDSLLKAIALKQLQKQQDQVKEKIEDQIKQKLPEEAGKLLNNLLGH